MSRSADSDLPAILGGAPVRPQGAPAWPPDDPEVTQGVQQCLADGSWGRYHGPHARELAAQIAGLHGTEHVLLCASGTAAVELALRGVGAGAGDEVLLAAYDFKGNFQDVLAIGGVPVLVDVSADNWNLDPTGLAAALTPRTTAILVSHLHGGLVPMRAVMQFARAHGLPVIEDACQQPGAIVCGQPAGTWGDVGVWSFGGSKLLSAGRGGALFTRDAGIAQRIRLYTHRGNDAYPLSELQAAALLPQLARLDEYNRRRSAAAQLLAGRLNDVPGLRAFSDVSAAAGDCRPAFYKVGLQYDPAAFDGLSRDHFAMAMRAEGIAIDPGLRALHRIHSRRRYRSVSNLPVATDADDRVLTLHHPILLEGKAGVAEILHALDRIRRSARMIRERSAACMPGE